MLGGKIHRSKQGIVIALDPVKASFPFPHQCALNGETTITIRPGTIATKFPTDGDEEFTLNFEPDFDENNRAWIVGNCRFDKSWKLTDWSYQHTTRPFAGKGPGLGGYETLDDGTVNLPVAILTLKENGSVTLFQHIHFNQDLTTRVQEAGSKRARHLFFAA